MLTPDTIRAEVKRRIQQERDIAAVYERRTSEDHPDGPSLESVKKLAYVADERAEALEELEQWIAAQMAKQAREYARQHYQGELAKHQTGEG